LSNQEDLQAAIKQPYQTDAPVLIHIPLNYQHNLKLSTNILPNALN
ncbi:hypothetical protein, partial [Staphylococcus capitis]